MLILRDILFRGASRFSELEANLGLASNTLASRLASFVDSGLLIRSPGTNLSAVRYEATAKAMDLKGVIMALTHWGDRWANEGPIRFRHTTCAGHVELKAICQSCHRVADPENVEAVSRKDRPLRVVKVRK